MGEVSGAHWSRHLQWLVKKLEPTGRASCPPKEVLIPGCFLSFSTPQESGLSFSALYNIPLPHHPTQSYRSAEDVWVHHQDPLQNREGHNDTPKWIGSASGTPE